MKRIKLQSIAISSLLVAVMAQAATRPHYGGAIHIAMEASPISLDPATCDNTPSATLQNLCALIFENLVQMDAAGRVQAQLVDRWEADPGDQRWHFHLRAGVTFDDGTPLHAEVAAASLRAAEASWKVLASSGTVIIECSAACSDLPAQLSLARFAIVRRVSGTVRGTGAFKLSDWSAGNKFVLTAREDYWGGRPFVDSVEVEMGRSLRDQAMEQDRGQRDIIEVAAEQIQHASLQGRRIAASEPMELMALVFSRPSRNPEEKRLRDALALSLDRKQLNGVLLQGGGEASAAVLPNWMTGYGFVFAAGSDPAQARQICRELKLEAPWTISYAANDALARLVVERITLGARDVGLSLAPTTNASSDIRLVRIPLHSVDANLALISVARAAGLQPPVNASAAAADLYTEELSLLQTAQVIPLSHLRIAYGVGLNLMGWQNTRDGRWHVEEVWMNPGATVK